MRQARGKCVGIHAIGEAGQHRHRHHVAGEQETADRAGLGIRQPPLALQLRQQRGVRGETGHREGFGEAHGECQPSAVGATILYLQRAGIAHQFGDRLRNLAVTRGIGMDGIGFEVGLVQHAGDRSTLVRDAEFPCDILIESGALVSSAGRGTPISITAAPRSFTLRTIERRFRRGR